MNFGLEALTSTKDKNKSFVIRNTLKMKFTKATRILGLNKQNTVSLVKFDYHLWSTGLFDRINGSTLSRFDMTQILIEESKNNV